MERCWTPVVLAAAAVLAVRTLAAPGMRYDGKALAAERAKRPLDAVAPTRAGAHETTPDAEGVYVYEATSLRPLVDGLPFQWKTNTAGLVTAQLRTVRTVGVQYTRKYNDGAYWTLAMPEGEYGLELLHTESGLAVYLNGRIVQMTSAGESLRPAPGQAFRPLRSGAAVRLRPGDELALMASTPYARDWHVARLRLVPGGIAPGRHYVAPVYDPHTGEPDTALAVTGQVLFYGRNGKMLPGLLPRDGGRNQRADGAAELETAEDGRPAVRCELFNPLPTPVEVEYDVALRSYYRLPVGGEKARVRLAPHTSWRKLIPFDALPDERAFSAELKVKVAAPQREAAWREAMRWPELDWIDFFPGMRQGMPWPRVFEDYDLRRLEFSEPVQAVRRRVLLSGDQRVWQAAYTSNWRAAWPTEEALTWEAGSVPPGGSSKVIATREPPVHAVYLRRPFVLPRDGADESAEIFLEGTSHEASLYVNGIEVGRVRGGNTPLWADITAAARPGTNELVILVRNALAIMNPEYVGSADPHPRATYHTSLPYLDAPGHYRAEALDVGAVELLTSPRVAARDLQVITSTRQKTLRTRFEVVNHRDRALKLRVRARVFDGNRPVFEAGEREIELAPGVAQPLEFATSWPKARWWWPFDPHLYVMHVETVDAETGARLDLLRERFGFRESWIDGPHMMFNDMAIRPKGSWLGYREAPNHFARGVQGSGGADWCDERGMLGGMYITALGNTSSGHNVQRDAFWEAAEANALQAARLGINNPSVARWDMSNEWLKFLDFSDPMVGARRFKKLSDAVRAFDPTRWTTFGSEGDVRGLMDHFDFHYMSPYFGAARMRGVTPYLPDGAFWRELQADYPPNPHIPLNSHTPWVVLRPEEKMFFEREYLWKVGGYMAPGTTAFLGEKAVAWSDWDSGSGPALWKWKQDIDGHRDVGVSLINHYTHPGLKRRALALQTFIVPEVQHHGFGGRTIERRYAVLQDLFRTCEMTFRWTLRGPDGKRLDGGEDRQRMSSGTTHRGVFRVKLPDVNTRTVCTLLLELESDGNVVMAEERDIDVWPSFAEATEGKPDAPVKVGELARKVVLFEPEGGGEFKVQGSKVQSARVQSAMRETRQPSTAAALDAMGLSFERITNFDVPILTPPHTRTPLPLLVIAEDALDESNRRSIAALADFVERGGRLLILRQGVTPGGLPAETVLDARRWASQCYIRAGNHPVVAGWTDMDVHFWAGDRAVTRGAYTKPAAGPATPIVDSGESWEQPRGLEWTGLLELYRGKGLYLLCQLPVAASYDQEPRARALLARMIDYLGAEEAFRHPTETLTVVAAADGPIVRRLQEVGAGIEVQSARVQSAKVQSARVQSAEFKVQSSKFMVDAAVGRGLPEGDREALAEALRGGATVVVAQAAPEDAEWLGALAGCAVRFGVPPYATWDGRGLRTAWTRATAGLSHADQYWKRFDGQQSAGGQAHDTRYVIEAFQEFAVSVDGSDAVESVWPGALVEVPVGAGLLILDQRNLYTANPELTACADRALSALVLGMGGRLAAAVDYPDMPAGIGYRPIDLGPWATRAFADETPEDGEGGWTDQGSGADLRSFPTHNRRLAGVPFVFPEGEKTCVVLSSPSRRYPEKLPKEVVIPLDAHAAGLYFLHATAYGGRPAAVYEIQYADGTAESIELASQVNVSDWVGPKTDFPRERGTRSVLAWTGSTPRFARVGIYRMEWVNRHPEKPLKALRFYKPEGSAGVPVLMGLTIALPPGTAGGGPTAEEKARALALAAEATAALAAGDAAAARTLADQALALDDACEDGYSVRADLADKAGDDDERLAVYQNWIDAGATRVRPYNMAAEIFERRGNLRGALDAYRQSLRIEWNQPPVIEAAAGLEERVK